MLRNRSLWAFAVLVLVLVFIGCLAPAPAVDPDGAEVGAAEPDREPGDGAPAKSPGDRGTAVDGADGGEAPASGGGGVAWPNAESRAISDPWLVQNHDRVTVMRPRVLAVSFVNDPALRRSFKAKVDEIAEGLAEGSRYHGYDDPTAPRFLEPQIAKYVDLSDPSPVAGWNHKNGSRIPLKCKAGAPYQFDYGKLFDATFAKAFGFKDPEDRSRDLPLCELVQRGDVHDVWLYVNGDPDAYTCPNGVTMSDFQLPEVLESKPKYDANDRRIAGQFDACAGNGCFSADDFAVTKACGRTIRILYINATRGPGCALHSLGHGIEWMAHRGSLRSLVPDFERFANMDLQRRLSLPFTEWYACSGEGCITYTGANSLDWSVGGRRGTIAKYDQGCGSVHFPPNARQHYDDGNTAAVLSTCEHFGLRDGAGGKDEPVPFTRERFQRYERLAPDCQGGWQIYWRQSFPGLATKARRLDGKPMKNWWPYLYY